jgi:sodium transport system permease protein
MRPAIVLAVLAKELLETLRDRRTVVMMIGLPLLLYPLLVIGAGRLQQWRRGALESRASNVIVWGALPEAVSVPLGRHEQLRLVTQDACPQERCPPDVVSALRTRIWTAGDDRVASAAREALRSQEVDAILVSTDDAGPALSEGRSAALAILYDQVRPDSEQAHRRLSDALEAIRRNLSREREQDARLPSGFSEALAVATLEVAAPERRTGQALGLFVPFLLIALSLMGGLYPAIDMTAGEKERGTMQTLLCAPIRPLEIIVGKFAAVWTIALTSGLINLVSLSATLIRIAPERLLDLRLSTIALTFLMLAPVTFTLAAVFLAVAALARDFKDGQNFLTPVYVLLMLPAGITMLPGTELDPWTAFVPIVNIALLVKSLLMGDARADLALLVAVASIAYAGLAMLFASRVFAEERVLLGGRVGWRQLLGLVRRPDGRATPALAFVLFATTLVLQFYGSLLLEERGLVPAVLGLQVGLILVPALAAVALFRLDVVPTLNLRRPSILAAVGAIVIGLTAWIAISGIALRLVAPPDGVAREMARALGFTDASTGAWQLVVLVALVPAVCEETLFRGVVLSGLRRLGGAAAVGGSAALFALAHASLYRLLPTLALGLLLGYVVWRSGSLMAGVLVHLLNNGMLVAATRSLEVRALVGWTESTDDAPPWPLTLAALVAVALGLLLVRVGRPRGATDTS